MPVVELVETADFYSAIYGFKSRQAYIKRNIIGDIAQGQSE